MRPRDRSPSHHEDREEGQKKSIGTSCLYSALRSDQSQGARDAAHMVGLQGGRGKGGEGVEASERLTHSSAIAPDYVL